ncbi:GntR family transcriptional regulator [Actinomycetospora termitidis]|uniref:GntR family transcriptional regulator n=1 Tax=Actinomycetospora termitidis TaxID=3053470 RepID=A0ABT7MHF9_9PSEU|nr:GntR family transcriptional regulator [Actinomycetospora sp. Odt1-22]MDL5160110.1 GntR family transcriptional regulator [Actinomycetospora sp. Odt1-22]
MASRGTAPSLTQRTFERLRADIVGGRLVPGERLRPGGIASAEEVSLNVVREALNRLAGARLVRASPQLGFTVATTSVDDLRDLTDVRSLVEGEALRRSIERGDLTWEGELVAAHHRLERTPMVSADRPDVLDEAWMDVHVAFHAATMSACGSPRMIEMVADLQECASLYRRWSVRVDGGRRDVAGEHRAIFEAAVARDADAACRAHLDHIGRTADLAAAAITGDPSAIPGS